MHFCYLFTSSLHAITQRAKQTFHTSTSYPVYRSTHKEYNASNFVFLGFLLDLLRISQVSAHENMFK